jgi:type I restriction enzyme S subunit
MDLILPKGWAHAKMLDLMDYQGGSQPPKKEFIYECKPNYIRLLQIRDFGDKPFPTFVPNTPKLKMVRKDDLLLARYGGSSANDSLGKICSGLEGAYNVALAKLTFNRELLSAKYVKYLFMGPWFREVVSKNSRSCQTGFNKSDIENVWFPIAPLNEQHRIVAKLDKLLAKVDKCKERLEKIPAILKRFRQSVLAAACSGELTASWRELNKNCKSKDFTTFCNANNISKMDEEVKLPIEWGHTRLESHILSMQNGLSKRSSDLGSNTVVLRLADIFNGMLLSSSKREIKLTNTEIEKYGLNKDDILITRVNGSPKIVGNFTLYERTDNWAFCDHFIRLKLKSKYLLEKYLIFVALSENARKHINLNMVSSAGQNTVSQETIKSLPVPLPTKTEQVKIVRRVESLFRIADEVETHFLKSKTFIDKLTQSILAKAFRGELVPQDPNDEPASELLKRIKAEKEQTKTSPSQGRKSTKIRKTRSTADDTANIETIEKANSRDFSAEKGRKKNSSDKTIAKALKQSVPLPAPTAIPDQQTIMAAFRKAFRDQKERGREDLLKEVASTLGFQRLSNKLKVKLQADMRAAMLRGIIQSSGDAILPGNRNIEEYGREDLLKFICSVMRKNSLLDEETVIQDTLKHLGFQRITDRMRGEVLSALKSGIRKGMITREKGQIYRP